ncbi:hypothetical protein D3C79_932260 [compost metagenome]
MPAFELDTRQLNKLKGTGSFLKDNEARAFLDEAKALLETLKAQARTQIREFTDDVPDRLPTSFSSAFFQDMRERTEQLEQQVDNALMTLDRLQRMARELEAT